MAIIDNEINKALNEALINGNIDISVSIAQKALDQGVLPLDLIQQVIVPILTKVGRDFQDFVIFYPS